MADKNVRRKVRANRRRMRVRSKIQGTSERPRLTVAKSLKNVFVQIVDDEAQHTMVGTASNAPVVRQAIKDDMNPIEVAKLVGKTVAQLAKEKGIEQVVFDRNQYRFHGRIKAVADGAREGGLKL